MKPAFDISSALAAYRADLLASGYSAASVEQYTRIINQYDAFCTNKQQNPSLPSSVSAYKAYMATDRGVRLGTVQYHLTVLRSFFAYCVETLQTLEDNPIHEKLYVNRKKLAAERRPYGDKLLSEEEIRALASCTSLPFVHQRTFLRNRAIVLTLVMCGLRNSELRALRPCDLDFRRSQITVEYGKGGKRRTVAFPAIARNAVVKYMQETRPKDLPEDALLFGIGESAADWHEIDRFSLSTLVRRYVEHATGHKGERSHALRHAYASTLLSNGARIQEIQTELGHSSIRTTERYAAMLNPHRANEHTCSILDNLFEGYDD